MRCRKSGSFALVWLAGSMIGCGSVVPLAPDASGGGDDAPAGRDGGGVDARTDAGVDASIAAPTIASVSPDWGSTAGGTHVVVTGTGFAGGHAAVKFGASAGTQVTVVSDTELRVTTPIGPHMVVAIAVTTDGGMASAPAKFRYLAPLYAADGRGVAPGNLYTIDPTNGHATTIGPLGAAMTGLALSPAGVLFGATSARGGAALVTIDPYTARVTPVGSLVNAAGTPLHTTDLAFEGSKLFGWNNATLMSIDPATGVVTPFPGQTGGGGMGLASNAAGSMFLSHTFKLATVSTATGAMADGPTMGGAMDSLTFVGGALYGAETAANPTATTLVVISPANGGTVVVGALPPNIDAIAGIPTQTVQLAAAAAAVPAPAPEAVSADAAAPVAPTVRIDGRATAIDDVLALGIQDLRDGDRVRRIVPLAALARLGLGARVELIAGGSEARVAVAIAAPGLALTLNHRGELKLVDVRAGFQRIVGPIVEIRRAGSR